MKKALVMGENNPSANGKLVSGINILTTGALPKSINGWLRSLDTHLKDPRIFRSRLLQKILPVPFSIVARINAPSESVADLETVRSCVVST